MRDMGTHHTQGEAVIITVSAEDVLAFDVLKIGGTAPEMVTRTMQLRPLGNVEITTDKGNTYSFSPTHQVRVEREWVR
jgi:hypothetical protein